MKKIHFVSIATFWISVLSLPLSFVLSCELGEDDIFHLAGIVRYSWIALLFVPVSIVSFVVGYKLKKQGTKYKKNVIISYITIPLLLIVGSYAWLMNDMYDYKIEPINSVETKANIDLPDNIKYATMHCEDYDISFIKILGEKETFEQQLISSFKWTTETNSLFKYSFPDIFISETHSFDYYTFFNCSDNTYNQISMSNEKHECVIIGYDCDTGKIVALNNYAVSLK